MKDRERDRYGNRSSWNMDGNFQQAVYDLRPARSFITNVQILIIFWIMGKKIVTVNLKLNF